MVMTETHDATTTAGRLVIDAKTVEAMYDGTFPTMRPGLRTWALGVHG